MPAKEWQARPNWRTIKIAATIVGIFVGILSIASYLVAAMDNTSTLVLTRKFALKTDLFGLRTEMISHVEEAMRDHVEKEDLRLRAISAEISADVSKQILTYLKRGRIDDGH